MRAGVLRCNLPTRSGVILGTSGGGLSTQDENYRAVYEDGKNRVHPFIVPKLMNNAAASHVSMEWNLQGPEFHGCDSLRQLQPRDGPGVSTSSGAGLADVMVTGGSEIDAVFWRGEGVGRVCA